MIVIGLTGGIGSGKSTVSSFMKTLGIPVFDADESSRAAVKKGSACLQKIVEFFGPDCLLDNGETLPVARGAYKELNDAFIEFFKK